MATRLRQNFHWALTRLGIRKEKPRRPKSQDDEWANPQFWIADRLVVENDGRVILDRRRYAQKLQLDLEERRRVLEVEGKARAKARASSRILRGPEWRAGAQQRARAAERAAEERAAAAAVAEQAEAADACDSMRRLRSFHQIDEIEIDEEIDEEEENRDHIYDIDHEKPQDQEGQEEEEDNEYYPSSSSQCVMGDDCNDSSFVEPEKMEGPSPLVSEGEHTEEEQEDFNDSTLEGKVDFDDFLDDDDDDFDDDFLSGDEKCTGYYSRCHAGCGCSGPIEEEEEAADENTEQVVEEGEGVFVRAAAPVAETGEEEAGGQERAGEEETAGEVARVAPAASSCSSFTPVVPQASTWEEKKKTKAGNTRTASKWAVRCKAVLSGFKVGKKQKKSSSLSE